MKGALPTTLHELFCNLVLCCIVRELDTHESETDTSEVRSLDDLPDDLKSKLSDLCVLAYEGVMQNKVVFYRDDLRKFNLPANLSASGGSNAPSYLRRLGLLCTILSTVAIHWYQQ